MSVGAKLMTAEEFLKLPSEGQRLELIRGEVVSMAPGGGEHGAVIMNVSYPVTHHVRGLDLGRVYGAETGYTVAHDPDTVRAPDFSFIRKHRLEELAFRGMVKGFIPGYPDLAVEVISANDALEDVEDKVTMWLEAGTQEVWVINPKRQTVSIYTSPTQVRILTAKDELDGGDLLPGFRYPVAKFFE